MTARQRINELMNELEILPKKSLGQNFLVSDHVIQKILQAAEACGAKTMLEIGPGLGSLTNDLRHLAPNFFVLELDRMFAQYWRKQNLNVIEVDALQWSWELIKFEQPVVLVSNLPYQISSSLVVDRSLDARPLDAMILMFQKEVAQRLKAEKSHSTYGFLSVLTQTFWTLETVLDAGSQDFFPPPKVASRVLKFTPRKNPIENKRDYLKFLKAAFSQPRKLLVSNLSKGLGIDKEKILELVKARDWSHQIRPQQLAIQDYLDLYSALGYK